MRWNIEERCEVIGEYIVETGATVRAAAAKFGISKSTVHTDRAKRKDSQGAVRPNAPGRKIAPGGRPLGFQGKNKAGRTEILRRFL